MANQVQTSVLVDGPTLTVIEVTGVLDSGNLTLQEIVNVANLDVVDQGTKKKATGLGVVRINHTMTDSLSISFYFQATPNDLLCEVSGQGDKDWDRVGHRYCLNPAKTGKILISTSGAIIGGRATFSLTIEMRKQTQ